jgi:pimeloyl-ACP methyl ester carboxylesterase
MEKQRRKIMNEKLNIVLIHGGFVDGSGWAGVYKILRKKGYNVSIVQNPTISLADDVAVTKRVIAAQTGRVVLVGHSYGGVVVTEAGNDPKVRDSFTLLHSPRTEENQGRRRLLPDHRLPALLCGRQRPSQRWHAEIPDCPQQLVKRLHTRESLFAARPVRSLGFGCKLLDCVRAFFASVRRYLFEGLLVRADPCEGAIEFKPFLWPIVKVCA